MAMECPVTIEIRAARPEEMLDYRRLTAYVFSSPDEPSPDDEFAGTLRPEWTTCAFVDGRLAATMGAYPFRVRLNGRRASVAGITAVGTYPEYRRQGLLRRIKQQGFAEQRERGQYVAMLWASMGAIYQRFGYGLASTLAGYEFDPRQTAFFHDEVPKGSVRITPMDEARPVMQDIYRTFAEPRNLLIERVEVGWDAMLRPPPKGGRYHVGVYRVDAEPRGYMVYRTKEGEAMGEPNPQDTMWIRDLAYLDLDAYRGLWAHVRAHDLIGRVFWHNAPTDDPAPDLLLEPRALRRRTGDAMWMRLTDVEQALPLRPYSGEGALTLRIRDDLCDWNDATYRLETSGEEAIVTPTSEAPDLSMSVNTLAPLFSGLRTATHLANAGLIEARDASALGTADRLFATRYAPWCPDGF